MKHNPRQTRPGLDYLPRRTKKDPVRFPHRVDYCKRVSVFVSVPGKVRPAIDVAAENTLQRIAPERDLIDESAGKIPARIVGQNPTQFLITSGRAAPSDVSVSCHVKVARNSIPVATLAIAYSLTSPVGRPTELVCSKIRRRLASVPPVISVENHRLESSQRGPGRSSCRPTLWC